MDNHNRANRYTIITGDALREVSRLPAGSIRSCITSPPYWGLRDYGIVGQIGAEPTLDTYIQSLVAVLREVRRVLTPDGTLWLNLGDGYTSGGRASRAPDRKNGVRSMGYRPPTPEGLKPKDLLGVPWRVALALQEDGWYLRQEIIWVKPNAQPESVRDRPTRAHETLFLLSKSERYLYDSAAVREPAALPGELRNRRSVWVIPTEPCPVRHIAAFPPALVEPCIRAGTAPGDAVLDPFFGSGTVGVVGCSLGRRVIGVELNPAYAAMARRRLAAERNLSEGDAPPYPEAGDVAA